MKKVSKKQAMNWGKKFEALKRTALDCPKCVQCGEEMPYTVNIKIGGEEVQFASVCMKPECPNFGLMQVAYIGKIRGQR